MRLITRSDFDGLACAVFLKRAGIIDSWKFVHPKDLQDGLVEITENDCLANVPFVEGCALWFDHHSSEHERNELAGKYKGESRLAPSAAQIIYDYYGGREFFGAWYDDLLEGVNKVDSADLTVDEILNPKGFILLGYIMDPRTGLGRFREFTISNYQLMERMIDWCGSYTIDEILAFPDVRERVAMYDLQTEKFKEMVAEHTTVRGNVIVTDLRGKETIYTGNRFLIYSLYPEQNISAWIVSGRGGQGCSAAVGYSVVKRDSNVNVGSLMLKYGGGGHHKVGTCQFSEENMGEMLPKLLDELVELAEK